MTIDLYPKNNGVDTFNITNLGMGELIDHCHSILPRELKEKFIASTERPDCESIEEEMEKSTWFGGEDAIKLADLLKDHPCQMLDEPPLTRSEELDKFLRESGGFIIR